MTIKVVLNNNSKSTGIPSKKKFEAWISPLFILLKKEFPGNTAEVCITIVNKKQSQQLNKKYRKKNKPTNILSFWYDAIPGIKTKSLGDLVICADVVKAEAKSQQKLLASHWAHLTLHGVLHLLGYDHENNRDAAKMESIEIKLLKKLGFGNPYEII